jgi:Flp pilus assembly protein TadD
MSLTRQTDVDSARAALLDGRLLDAVRLARESRRRRPDDALAAWLEGRALLDLERTEEALAALSTAASLLPDSSDVHLSHGAALATLGRMQDAYQAYIRALELAPSSPEVLTRVGGFLLERGELGTARAFLETAYRAGSIDALASLVQVCEREGRADEAFALLDRLPESFPTPPALVLAVARLMRSQGESARARGLLESLVTLELSPRVAVRVHHFLGAVLEDLGEHAGAFAAHARANELRGLRYDALQHEARTERILASYTRERFAREPRVRAASELPVLIVGMPRSGTSLVEQILSSHPAVHAAGELDELLSIQGRVDPESRSELEQASREYCARLEAQSAGCSRVTDKMPHNFLALGTAALIVPGARVVHCRRDARDTCLSIFFHDFHATHDYATDLTSLGHQWRQYERVMAHWREHLPLPMHEVSYEVLVADPEAEIRRLVEFLGLEWDPAVLEFHRSARVVRTASWGEVRRPIHRESVGRAGRYASELSPLDVALA